MGISLNVLSFSFQLNTEWTQIEVIDLMNDGTGLGFGIIGGRSTGVVVKTILPGGVADAVRILDFMSFGGSLLLSESPFFFRFDLS